MNNQSKQLPMGWIGSAGVPPAPAGRPGTEDAELELGDPRVAHFKIGSAYTRLPSDPKITMR